MVKVLVLNKHRTVSCLLKLRQAAQTFPFAKSFRLSWLELKSSLLLALACRRARLVGAMAGLPQQWGAEDADDGQIEEEADDQHPDGPQEGGHRPMGRERRPP